MIKMCGKRILHTLRMEISFCLMLESFPAIVLRRICLTATGAPVWRGGRIHNQLYCTYQSNINTTRLSTASLLIWIYSTSVYHRATSWHCIATEGNPTTSYCTARHTILLHQLTGILWLSILCEAKVWSSKASRANTLFIYNSQPRRGSVCGRD